MFFHLRCAALLGLLSWPYATAQSFQNASSAQQTLSTSFNSTVTPSPSRTLNSSSHGYVQSCNSAWQSYRSNIARPYTTDTVAITTTHSVSTSLLGIQTCSSYCGSICYAGSLTITSTLLIPGTYRKTEYSYPTRLTYSEPAPNCTVPASDCRQLWTSYTSADLAWSKTWGLSSPLTPGCTAGCQRTTCRFGGGDKGAVPTPGVKERYWNSLKLFYFPETRNVSRDMCASTPTQTAVPLVTYTDYIPTTTEGFVVQNGKTLYKGNVYISIDQLEVGDNCGYTTVMHDIAFPVASTDIQSQRADRPAGNGRYWPVDWADFDEPVPYSAYVGGQGMTFPAINPGEIMSPSVYCKTAICGRSSVLAGEYNPWMILPQAIKKLNPDFADCQIPDGFTWFDPPIALHSAPNFLTTKSPDPASTPATPADPVGALPVQTPNPAPAAPPSGGAPPYDPPAANKPPTNNAPPAAPPMNIPPNYDPPPVDPGTGGRLPYNPPTSNPPSNEPGTGGQSPNNPLAPTPPSNEPGTGGQSPNNPLAPNPPFNVPGSGGQFPNNPAYSRPALADPASRPQITVGPTVIPVAPDGQGLVIQSPTTIAPSASAVIGSTTFHLSSGVLTMESAGGTSSITLGDPAQNGIGTVVGLGNGGAFTISTAGGSLVFNVRTTIGNGDPAQTVGDMVISVGSDGVHVSNVKNGEETSIAFADIEGMLTRQEGSFNAAAFTGASFSDEDDATAAHTTGDSAANAQNSAAVTSSLGAASTQPSEGGSGSASTARPPSASRSGPAGSSGDESQTGALPGSTSGPNKGAAASVPIPWYLFPVSICTLVLYL